MVCTPLHVGMPFTTRQLLSQASSCRTLWGPFLYIYEGPCHFWASFGPPQIEQYICLPIGSCLVEDCRAVVKQRPEEHLLQEREPLPNVERLPNSDPVLSKRDRSFGLIESQLSQCKCIVIVRTMSYSNGKQLVRSGMCSWQDRWMKVVLRSECDQPPPMQDRTCLQSSILHG